MHTIAIAAAVLVLGLCVHSARGAEIVLPGASLGGSAAAEAEGPARDEGAAASAMHGASGSTAEAPRRHLQPDSAGETHGESGVRGNVGTDAGSGRTQGRWQSLLPGVMK